MTTPNTQPTELDKAIEAIAETCASKITFNGKNFILQSDWEEAVQIVKDEILQSELLLAAKRLKEVEKERDDLHHRMMGQPYGEQVFQLKRELSTLRTSYKQALEALNAIRRQVEPTGKHFCLDCLNTANNILSTPLAIETMKGDQ